MTLRGLLITAFLVPLLAGVGLTGWLLIRNNKNAVDELTVQLRHELAFRIHDYLEGFLAVPHRFIELDAELLRHGRLDPRDPEGLARHFSTQLRYSDALSFLFLGTAAGGAAGAGRNAEGVPVVDATDVDPEMGPTAGTRHEYRALADGSRGALIKASPGFDSRQRPWFRAAVEAGGPVWSEVYPFFAERTLAVAASRPVLDDRGELIGVLGADLALTEVGEFLGGLEVGRHGLTFIIERCGHLIASSTRELPFVDGDEPHRLTATESSQPLIAATAGFLEGRFDDLAAIAEVTQLHFDLDGERHLVDVLPLSAGPGLDWLIVVVVPERDFMSGVAADTRTTLWLCAVALLSASGLGLVTSNHLSRPVHRLGTAAEAMADGDLDHRVPEHGIDELDRLGDSFNRMAARLERSFAELENRVRQRTAELRQAKETAEGANRAKTDFLSTVSHEIRTPLAAILGYTELLADGDPRRDDADLYLRTIRDQGEHLRGLVEDLLDVDRIEAGKLQLEPRACDLDELLAQLESAFRPRAEEKGLELELVAEAHLPWRFIADPLRLRQVLANLLANAIKYTSHGRVALVVTVDSDSDTGGAVSRLVFEIVDTGPGISEADRQRLFERFSRLSADREGFGLGLAITRQLAELMGGTVDVDSRLGEGSTFSVSLPVTGCDDWRRGGRRLATPRCVRAAARSRLNGRVLIAEDSQALRELCEHNLRRWGLECFSVRTGEEAIRWLDDRSQAHEDDVDIVLMDWQMPELDGLEATRRLRAAGFTLPIIALTAAASPADRRRCLDAGCDAHLGKPLDFSVLHGLLSGFLGTVAEPAPDVETTELARSYIGRLPVQLETLREALGRGEWRDFDSALHRLAGTAGSYGLNEIFTIAEQLEASAARRDPEHSRPLLDSLAEAVGRAAEESA